MLGLVLEGGGAKGAYQIGAWRALRELNIAYQGVAGTSIGALNGAFFMQEDYESAYAIWYDMRPSLVMNGDEALFQKLARMDIEGKDFQRVLSTFRGMAGQKGIDISPLRQLVNTYLNETEIRASDKTFGIMTVSLTDMKPVGLYKEDIPMGQMAEYLIASANLPIFKLERIEGKLYVDGGFYDNLPVKLLTARGFDEIITIELNGLGIKQKWQTTDSVRHIAISPSEDLGRTLAFIPENARRNMAMGYFDAMKALRDLKGQRYYIEAQLPSRYYLEWLLRVPEPIVQVLAYQMGLSMGDPQRVLMEQIMPKFAQLLKLGPDADYRDIVLALLEHVATGLSIDRYVIFKDNEFMQKVVYELSQKPNLLAQHHQSLDKMPKLIKQTKLYQNLVMDFLAYALLDGLMQDSR